MCGNIVPGYTCNEYLILISRSGMTLKRTASMIVVGRETGVGPASHSVGLRGGVGSTFSWE
jgi:hypothetical protein